MHASLARLAVVDGRHSVAVRVERERGVVPGVVVTLTRCTVVPAACGKHGAVERIDGRSILRLEGKVHARKGPCAWSASSIQSSSALK